MKSLPLITFPKAELNDIKTRIEENKIVYTIRVSDEYGKYKFKDLLMTEWGSVVKIMSIEKIVGGINELKYKYKHFNQLTSDMIKELEPFQYMEIISLNKID